MHVHPTQIIAELDTSLVINEGAQKKENISIEPATELNHDVTIAQQKRALVEAKSEKIAQSTFLTFPNIFLPNKFSIKKLNSLLEIKKWWLYNEWDPVCQFSKFVQEKFPDREDLHPENGKADKELIESTFFNVRGKFSLWGSCKEEAKWIKIVVQKLELIWVENNVEVLYPTTTEFEVSQLNGLVLWKDPDKNKYQLLEGNHRVSAWKISKKPESLSSIIFIGHSSIKPE